MPPTSCCRWSTRSYASWPPRNWLRRTPGQTLQATALVHEAYLRLVDVDQVQHWDSRGHFFAAAAEAMRRILVENTRRHRAQKRGGGRTRIDLPELAESSPVDPVDLLALDEALTRLEALHPHKAQIVKLRFFAGCGLRRPPRCSASPAQQLSAIGLTPGPGSLASSITTEAPTTFADFPKNG